MILIPSSLEGQKSSAVQLYWKNNVPVKTIKSQKCEGHGSIVSTSRKVPSFSFPNYLDVSASLVAGALDVPIHYELGLFFCECLVLKSVLFFTKETTKYQCEKTEEEAQDSETKEEKEELNENKKDPKRM